MHTTARAQAHLLSVAPKLATANVSDALAFYGKLGFTTAVQYDDYAIVQRDEVYLHLSTWDEVDPRTNPIMCYIYVSGIEALYAECQALNVVHPNAPLQMKPWGLKEFSIVDPSGNLITFGERRGKQETL